MDIGLYLAQQLCSIVLYLPQQFGLLDYPSSYGVYMIIFTPVVMEYWSIGLYLPQQFWIIRLPQQLWILD
jgi:hypothetical protein